MVTRKVRELTRALNDRRWWVRSDAARALGKIGPGAVSAVPALQAARKDENIWVRVDAAWALGQING
jgi:HEAT repeat protein